MNLVLEWCAGGDGEDGQRRMLSEVARVLRHGGLFQVSTKNRFAIRYLLGRPDEHCHNLPFGHALPRPFMRALLRATGHRSSTGTLHSYRKLALMLREAGLQPVRSYWAVPEMRFPHRFVPTDAASVRAARREGFRQGGHRSDSAVMRWLPAALVKHFTPGLFFIATRASPS
jgi:hypothetical protein